MKIVALLLTALSPLLATGPAWDTSGNGLLSGTYNFRQVQYVSDGSSNIVQALAYFGTIGFDGIGTYTLSGNNTVVDSGGTAGIPSIGTYSIASSGYGFLSNPLAIGQSVYILVSKGIIIGSSTENPGSNKAFNNDLFVAAPATPAFTNASFIGAYTVDGFLPGNDVTYQLTPDGAGNLGTVNKTGYNETGSYLVTVAGASYTFSGGVGQMSIGLNNVDNGMPVSYGQETLYMSPDKDFIFGGSPGGYDFFVGVRNPASATSLTSNLYYEIGIDEDASNFASGKTAAIDTYYGSFNAFSGNIIGHERLLYAGSSAEGVTYATTYPSGSYTGPANVGQLDPSATVQYTLGAGNILPAGGPAIEGGIRIGFGIGPWLGIEVAVPSFNVVNLASGSVDLDPTGIVNAASSAPFTAGISPGEFISLYNGSGLAGSPQCWTAGPPFPTTLGGVQVLINGAAAPIYCVGSPITVIVPNAVSASPIATIQVVNNNVSSNTVTAFVYPTTPGVFSYNPSGGIGFAAAQHAGYVLVTPANPALPGEEIAVYLTGLGATNSTVGVNVAGIASSSILYAGPTPDPGLYQINFVVPASAPAGNDVLAITGPNSFSAETLLPVGGTNPKIGNPFPNTGLPRLQGTIHR